MLGERGEDPFRLPCSPEVGLGRVFYARGWFVVRFSACLFPSGPPFSCLCCSSLL